jgi:hypothetical protein
VLCLGAQLLTATDHLPEKAVSLDAVNDIFKRKSSQILLFTILFLKVNFLALISEVTYPEG